MDRNTNKGAITIYLSIILSAFILLCGVLMDVVRIKVAEVQLRRAASTAAVSALAGYDAKLKQDYGLFALHNNDKVYLKEEVEYYFTNQLVNDVLSLDKKKHVTANPISIYLDGGFKQVSFIDLFDYKVESLYVTPIYNLTENEIARHQVVEYMKYRAPVQLAESFIDKVKHAASADRLASGYKQKILIEKKFGNIEKAIKRLQKSIDTLNGFTKEDYCFSSGANSDLIILCKNIILREIYNACMSVDIEKLQDKDGLGVAFISDISTAYDEAAKQVASSKEDLEKKLSSCIEAVDQALREIAEINNQTIQIQQDIERLKQFINTSSPDMADKALEEKALSAMEKDIEGYSRLLQSSNTQGVLKDLESNKKILEHLRTNLFTLDNIVSAASRQIAANAVSKLRSAKFPNDSLDIVNQLELDILIERLRANDILASIAQAAEEYRKISNVLDGVKSSKGVDPRKEAAEALKRILAKPSNNSTDTKVIEKPELLPSYFLNGSYPNKIFSEGQIDNNKSYYIPTAIEDFEADFGEDSSFAQEGFEYIADFAYKLKQKALDMRDEIYVNEYILKTFKDAVEIADSNTDGKYAATLFDRGEVEYIIAGKAQEDFNKILVKGQILLIRLGMNTLHVYGDSQKRLQALEIATAVAGFTGFGIPIVHNLIMCAWGAAEAHYDMQDLYKGQKVPFIKTSESWRTNLQETGFSAKNNSSREAGLLDFDYHDYLRLFLLVEDSQTKVNRVQDIIQLNMQLSDSEFELNGSNTYIKVEALVSIKYWFITKLFVPAQNKTSDGNRHIIKIEAWRGY